MKKWTHSEARSGRSVSPKIINDEMRAQQSSMTTIDRTQLPDDIVDDTYLEQYALHQVWCSTTSANIEQTNESDTDVGDAAWISSTIQTASGGWRTLQTVTLTGFKGGNLFIEWGANVYVNNIFAYGLNDGKPGTPNYMALRILVNGVNIGERRGAGFHQMSRIFGSQLFPPGDLSVSFQWKYTAQSEDARSTTSGGDNVPYGHVWNHRWIAIARYR